MPKRFLPFLEENHENQIDQIPFARTSDSENEAARYGDDKQEQSPESQ